MNWAAHPTLYQFFHPFHWLTYGQNAAGVQTLVAVLATLAAIAAGIFAGYAYFATVRQVKIGEDQLELARKTFEEERARYEQEKAAANARILAEYQRTAAQENAVRPRFQTGGFSATLDYPLEYKNVGSSPAIDVEFLHGITKAVFYKTDLIPVGATVTVKTDVPTMQTSGIEIRFRTEFGSHWRIMQWIQTSDNPNRERVLKVDRIYEPK